MSGLAKEFERIMSATNATVSAWEAKRKTEEDFCESPMRGGSLEASHQPHWHVPLNVSMQRFTPWFFLSIFDGKGPERVERGRM